VAKGLVNLAAPIEIIAERVAIQYGKTVEQLQSKRRTEDLVYPRQLAMSLCYEAGHSYRAIMEYFNRCIGSMTYTNNQVNNLCSVYEKLHRDRIAIARELGINV